MCCTAAPERYVKSAKDPDEDFEEDEGNEDKAEQLHISRSNYYYQRME
jgi:hypothetical protein